jgi:hypothetical protein
MCPRIGAAIDPRSIIVSLPAVRAGATGNMRANSAPFLRQLDPFERFALSDRMQVRVAHAA